jgi:hypothetical protein
MTVTAPASRVLLPPAQTIPDLFDLLEHAIRNQPRTLQTTLGPSEIGVACDRCLIDMLAGRPHYADDQAPWLPTIGNAVHDWIEQAIVDHLIATGTDRYIPEGKIAVGQVRGVDITGHSDVYDVHTGTVVDWKVTGTTTLRKVTRSGASLTYRRQAHLYGRGWALAGYDVRSVAIAFLPRNGFSLRDGRLWQEPYDEAIALEALDRANTLAGFLDTFGYDAVTAGAPAHTLEEFTCPKEGSTADASSQLKGLIP